jgi:transcriptional regulator with XRE-family HTH domain
VINSDQCQHFSQRFASLIKEKNLTQSSVAELLDISQSAVSYLLSGRNLPSVFLLNKISGLFNISMSELIGEEGNKNIEVNQEKQKAINDLVETIRKYNVSPEAINNLTRFVSSLIESRSIRSTNDKA